MGTRVDFYVGRGEQADWLGSYPFDGYPDGIFTEAPSALFNPTSPANEQQWRDWVAQFLASSDIATTPEMGWPWPWKDSKTTDYAYAWDAGVVYGSNFGHTWFAVDPTAEQWGEPDYDEIANDGKPTVFPDMTSRERMTIGPRSGLIVLGPVDH